MGVSSLSLGVTPVHQQPGGHRVPAWLGPGITGTPWGQSLFSSRPEDTMSFPDLFVSLLSGTGMYHLFHKEINSCGGGGRGT